MRKSLLIAMIFGIALLFSSCKTNIIQENFDFAEKQLTYALQVIDSAIENDTRDADVKEKDPLVSPRTLNEDGTLQMTISRSWTSGFFPGTLWYMYEYTQDPKWKEKAIKFTAAIEKEKSYTGTHDLGFMMFDSFGNGLRLTNNESYKPILIESAKSLTTRYVPNAKTIRSWD